MRQCERCRSYAINPDSHGRQEGQDLDLCDVCYWRKRAEEAEAETARLRELVVSECERGFLEGAKAEREGWDCLGSNQD